MCNRFWIDFGWIWGSFLTYFGSNLAPMELWDEDQRGNWRQLLPPAGQVTPRQEKCSSREAPGSAKIDLQICYGVPKVSPKASEIKQKLKKIRIDKPLLNFSRWKVDFDGFQMQKWLIKKTGFEDKSIIDEKIADIQKHRKNNGFSMVFKLGSIGLVDQNVINNSLKSEDKQRHACMMDMISILDWFWMIFWIIFDICWY